MSNPFEPQHPWLISLPCPSDVVFPTVTLNKCKYWLNLSCFSGSKTGCQHEKQKKKRKPGCRSPRGCWLSFCLKNKSSTLSSLFFSSIPGESRRRHARSYIEWEGRVWFGLPLSCKLSLLPADAIHGYLSAASQSAEEKNRRKQHEVVPRQTLL